MHVCVHSSLQEFMHEGNAPLKGLQHTVPVYLSAGNGWVGKRMEEKAGGQWPSYPVGMLKLNFWYIWWIRGASKLCEIQLASGRKVSLLSPLPIHMEETVKQILRLLVLFLSRRKACSCIHEGITPRINVLWSLGEQRAQPCKPRDKTLPFLQSENHKRRNSGWQIDFERRDLPAQIAPEQVALRNSENWTLTSIPSSLLRENCSFWYVTKSLYSICHLVKLVREVFFL